MKTAPLRVLHEQYLNGEVGPASLLQHWIALCDIIDLQDEVIQDSDRHFEEITRAVKEITG